MRTISVNCRESAGTESVQVVTGATFEGHHRSINVQLSFPNCCLVYLLRYAPCERTFVTALIHQLKVVEISKIGWLLYGAFLLHFLLYVVLETSAGGLRCSNVTEGAAAPNAQAQR